MDESDTVTAEEVAPNQPSHTPELQNAGAQNRIVAKMDAVDPPRVWERRRSASWRCSDGERNGDTEVGIDETRGVRRRRSEVSMGDVAIASVSSEPTRGQCADSSMAESERIFQF